MNRLVYVDPKPPPKRALKRSVQNFNNKRYVLWNVYLPKALHFVSLNRLSCTEVGIYNGANSPNGFLTPAVV